MAPLPSFVTAWITQQLAYRVSDIEVAMATPRAAGLRLLYDTPRRGTAGSRINFVHPSDAGGVLIELVEPRKPEGPQQGAE